jgi:hypothetical protein
MLVGIVLVILTNVALPISQLAGTITKARWACAACVLLAFPHDDHRSRRCRR